ARVIVCAEVRMEDKVRQIYLVRHGESDWNRIRRIQGNFPGIALSERGRRQAELLGGRLSGMSFDRVICSDVERAVETARIALGDDHPMDFDNELREIAFGEWEGRLVTELEEESPGQVAMWFRKPSSVEIAGAEPFLQFHGRVRRRMDEIIGSTEGDLLIIAHGGVICAWLTHILGMAPDDIWAFSLANTSMTTVKLEFRPRVRLLGDASHLDALNLGFDGMPSASS
ncbi:MAG TPA: histidine phosphatase family protein, partial [Candidatus Krumholzibacterium sp.]|nr:histidine phosphatase family protein [Candidatus Krumholzibacterium sp.]